MSSSMSISKMNELLDLTISANNEISSIVQIINTLQENLNKKVELQEASFTKTKNLIQDFMSKIANKSPIDLEALSCLLSDNSEYLSIISLTKLLDEKISLVQHVKDALKVNDFSDSLSSNARANSNHLNEAYDDSMSIDFDEPNGNNDNPYQCQRHIRKKRNRPREEEDDDSYILSPKENKSRSSDEEYHCREDKDQDPVCKRKRRPLIFCRNSVTLDKYKTLDSSPLQAHPLFSEESSDFLLSSIELDPTDRLPELSKEKESLMPLVLNDMQNYSSKYLMDNFDRLMHLRTMYYCYYDMLVNPPECHYEYFPFDCKVVQGSNDFRFVKLVLVRKPGGKIQNVILGCSNLFNSYLSRKDIDGNTLIKGELKVTFETFHYYFFTGIKGFGHLSQVQIEVFVHKNELFQDYNEVIDKSNLRPEQMKRYAQMGERLKLLRRVDKKIQLLNKKPWRESIEH